MAVRNEIPAEPLNCRNLTCNNPEHIECITSFYNDILDSLLKAGLFITTYKSNCHVQLPGWTEYVSDLYDYSKTCHQSWLDANEPRQGFIHNIYIRTRARFKYALRSIKRNEEQMRKESMAKNLSDRKIKEFWKEVSITNNCKTPLPDNIDEANGSKEIVNL